MNREDAKDAKEEERRMRQLGEQVEQLAYRAIGAAIEVHRLLGPGFLESVYQESLEVEFRMRWIPCHPKKPVSITYKGYPVGLCQLDFLVGDILIGEPTGTPKTQKVLQTFEHFWTDVQAKMDVDNDSQVTPEEWRNGLRKSFAEYSEAYKAGFGPLAEAIFTICVRDDKGFLEQSEFAKFHQAFGCKSANSQLAFQKLDSNGDGQLTVDELPRAWQEYYTSNDPNARDNWLYGDVWENRVVFGSKTI